MQEFIENYEIYASLAPHFYANIPIYMRYFPVKIEFSITKYFRKYNLNIFPSNFSFSSHFNGFPERDCAPTAAVRRENPVQYFSN